MQGIANPCYNYKNIAASTSLKNGDGQMGGIFVSSATGANIVVYDNGTAASGTKIAASFGASSGKYYPMPAAFVNGLTVGIAGTISCTVLWK